ncbi:Structural maintenance of chromosomes protein 6 [Massospora cicadina]|nr:Structural maintenance of chromosomes protein 6 [Massospora cicadina]
MSKRRVRESDSDPPNANHPLLATNLLDLQNSSQAVVETDMEDGEDFNVAGAIKSIQLENFMCHEHLYVDFYPKINFIVGSNGSGKSAILTGLIVCLGAKASSTSRASSLRFLVKEGASSATVTLQLWNRGTDAFKPEVYGKVITIKRKIQGEASGGGFKIISEQGKTVSTKKEDLMAICDHMKIQPDNPISILSQETAKKFIGATNPHDKYQLFLKATHLSQLADDLSLIETTFNSAFEIVEQKKKVLPELRQALQQAQECHKRLREAHDQHRRIQSLKNEMAWAHVVEAEREKEKEALELERAKSRIEQIETFMNKTNADYEKAAGVIAELEQRKAAQRERETSCKAALQQLKASRIAALKGREDSQRTLDRINKDSKAKRTRIRELEASIAQEKAKAKQSSSIKLEQAKVRIGKLEEEIHGLERTISEREQRLKEEDVALSTLATQMQALDGERRQIMEKQSSCHRQLQEMQRSREDRLAAYGSAMPKVLSDIQKESRWRDKPLGPLGRYLELSDPRWSNIVEQLLDKALTSFIVTSHEDRHILSAILNRNQCPSIIYVCNLDNFDYSGGEPDPRFVTILRTLTFKNELVKRQLIVANKIEQIILVDQRREGDALMNRAPHNVIGCYTKDGYQVGLKGGYGTFAMPPFSKAPKLSGFSATRAQELQMQDRHLNSQLEAKEASRNKLQAETARINAAKGSLMMEINDARKRVRSLKAEIAEIQQDMKEQEEALLLITKQFEAETETFVAAENRIQELETNIQATLTQLQELASHAEAFQDDIDKAKESQGKFEAALDHYKRKLHATQESARNFEQRVAACAQSLLAIMEKARAYCPERVPVTKAPDSIGREIQKAEKALAQAQECMGMTLEECTEDFNLKATAYKSARREIGKIETFLKDLKAAWEVRSQRWVQFRHYMSKRTRYSFMYNLSVRNFRGTLEFDHADQTLAPIVNLPRTPYPLGSRQRTGFGRQNQGSQSSLGGEKSFSTICLLLALWESMECPIRCLDEYDVFMDQANRKVSTSMIIDSARKASKVQYLLITPQGMDRDSVQRDVHVHKLDDPRGRAGQPAP